MKSNRYPLEALIQIRTQELEAAQQAFSRTLDDTALARKALQAALEKVRQVEQSIVELEDRFRRATQAQALAAGFLESFPARRKLLGRRLEQAEAGLASARKDLAAAEEREEAARAQLAEARKELEVVERHREQWVEKRRAKRLAAEDEQAEELAARRPLGSR